MSNAMLSEEKVYTELHFIRQELADLKVQLAQVTRGHAPYPYIARDTAMHSGEPTVYGSAITVRAIVERSRLGETPAQIVEAYLSLTLAQIHAALGYYYDHTEEIERYMDENQAALWRTKPSGSL